MNIGYLRKDLIYSAILYEISYLNKMSTRR